jgi:co-chaperonin GroES (HSP10)
MLEPLNNKLLVKEIIEEKTEGGIILPGKKDEGFKRGKVLEQAYDVPMPIAGKVIVFNKFTPVEYVSKGEKYLIVKFEDIYGIEQSK